LSSRPRSSVTSGLPGFGVFFNWVLLVLIFLLPWLAPAATVWIGLVLVLRQRRRRRAVPPLG
jgi:hypothetical protein